QQVRLEHGVVLERRVVARRRAHEEVLRKLVERVVAEQEAERAQRQQGRDPGLDVQRRGRGQHQRRPSFRLRTNPTTLPKRMKKMMTKWPKDMAPIPLVPMPGRPTSCSYSAAPAMPPSSPKIWPELKY